MRRLFKGGAYSDIVLDQFLFLCIYSTVHFLSVNFAMDWYQTVSKSRITREIHAVKKKTREFHDNESENISGESIGGAALIWGRGLLTFLSQMRRFFEGSTYSSKYGILLIFSFNQSNHWFVAFSLPLPGSFLKLPISRITKTVATGFSSRVSRM